MRYYAISFAFILFTSPAYADVLLTEVTKEFDGGTFPLIASETIAWQPRYSEPSVFWNADAPAIGVPVLQAIPPELSFNSLYHIYDFSISNPAPVSHAFKWFDGRGFVMQADLSPVNLFTTGTYGSDPSDSPFTVVSHYSPPNGNSFIGTTMHFSAIELTINKHIYPTNQGDHEVIQFTARFFGVPEPATISLFAIGAAIMSQSRKRRP